MDLNKYLIFKIYLSSGVYNKVCHTLQGEDSWDQNTQHTKPARDLIYNY